MPNQILLFSAYGAPSPEGELDECISCYVTEEINSSFEAQLEYPATGRLANSLQVGKFIVCKPNPYSQYDQFFHIYRVAKRTDYTYTIYAEHVTYASNHFICLPEKTYADTHVPPAALMSYLNTNAAMNPVPIPGFGIQFSSTISNSATWSVSGYTEVRNVMSMAAKQYGGEWQFDNNSAVLVQARGQDRQLELTNATNLVSLSHEEDISDIYTHIFPYWTGNDANGDEVTVYANPRFIDIWSTTRSRFRAYVYDCSNVFPTEPTPAELTARAEAFAQANLMSLGLAVNGFSVDVVQRGKTVEGAHLTDADHIELGDTIYIRVSELNIDAAERITAVKYDVLRDMIDSVVIGQRRTGITDLLSAVQQQENEKNIEKSDEESGDSGSGSGSEDESGKIPDKVVKVDSHTVYALYDDSTTKVTWTADGSGNERYNFKKKVEKVEP